MSDMQRTILDTITERARRGDKMLVRLIDPDKFDAHTLHNGSHAGDAQPGEGFDFYFVGGSTCGDCTAVVRAIHDTCPVPVILFPGSPRQFTPEADALLFLTLMNSRDPRFLIEQHIQSADAVVASGIETIPMGYILVDGGRVSTTQRLTGAQPLPQQNTDAIVRMARTAELLGKRLIYLEAGSGALTPVGQDVIRAVRRATGLPLIAGGGIRSVQQMNDAFRAGADLVVIGNHFEEHPESVSDFTGALSGRCRCIIGPLSGQHRE